MVLVVKNLTPKEGDVRDAVLIPGSERSPGGGHSNPLQYSCLENPMDGGAWWPAEQCVYVCAGEGNGNPLQYAFLKKSYGQRSLVGYSP